MFAYLFYLFLHSYKPHIMIAHPSDNNLKLNAVIVPPKHHQKTLSHDHEALIRRSLAPNAQRCLPLLLQDELHQRNDRGRDECLWGISIECSFC